MPVDEGGAKSGEKGKGKGRGKGLKGDKLTAAMLKMLLMNAQMCREIRGAVFIVFMILESSLEYIKMKEQLVAYNSKVQEAGKGHGMGPPSGYCFGGLIMAMVERGSTIGMQNQTKAAELSSHWENLTVEESFDMVPHCRGKKAYDKTMFKLEFLITGAEVRDLVKNSLTQSGAKRLLGQAPEGGLEAALSRALSSMST